MDQKKKKKWFLQSYLIGIPEICIGYRDQDFILHSMDRVPLDQLYHPPGGTLENAYGLAHQVLQELRLFCSGLGHNSRVWKVTVQRGTFLGRPQAV